MTAYDNNNDNDMMINENIMITALLLPRILEFI